MKKIRPLKIYLGELTYTTVTLATEAFPLNVGFIGSYCKKLFGNDIEITLFKYIEDIDKAVNENPRRIDNVIDITRKYPNLSKTIELCHLSVNNFYITPEVSGIATMIREERENSAIVLDIGANITSIGVYLKGKLIFSDTIPL